MEELFGANGQASEWADQAIALIMAYAPKVLLAIVTLIIGLWLINRFVRVLDNRLGKKDPTLNKFLCGLISAILKILLLISVASMVGIATTSFVAIIGAAGLAVGLALQGSLANFAGGALILFLRPFRAGEYIEAQGVGGTVDSIQIFNTILKTPDNKTVIIPNGSLSNGNIINYSRQPTRRVDLNIGIDYGDDVKKARSILLGLAAADSRVMKDPEAVVWLVSLGDNSVNLSLRMWTKTEDFWGVFWDIQEQAKEAFDAQGITIPFPQRTVHMVTEAAAE